MNMEMHMLHIMYGWSDNVTLYAMPMLSSLTMDHIRGPMNPAPQGPGSPFTTHNSGFDDTGFGALWRVYKGQTDSLVLNLGFTVPTGELDRTSTAPTGGLVSQELPYPMRRGSGTFNARPGATYMSYYDHGSLGLQFQSDLPVGRNKEGYSVSDTYRLSAWYSWLACDRLAFSYRLETAWRSNFHGADPDLNGAVISTARPDMRGGEWVNFGYGTALLLNSGGLLSFEAVHPVYEHLNGIQLENDWWLFASWSRSLSTCQWTAPPTTSPTLCNPARHNESGFMLPPKPWPPLISSSMTVVRLRRHPASVAVRRLRASLHNPA